MTFKSSNSFFRPESFPNPSSPYFMEVRGDIPNLRFDTEKDVQNVLVNLE